MNVYHVSNYICIHILDKRNSPPPFPGGGGRDGTAMGFLWDFNGIAMGLLRDCYGVAMGLLWDCYGIAIGLLWRCYWTAMRLL